MSVEDVPLHEYGKVALAREALPLSVKGVC